MRSRTQWRGLKWKGEKERGRGRKVLRDEIKVPYCFFARQGRYGEIRSNFAAGASRSLGGWGREGTEEQSNRGAEEEREEKQRRQVATN